MNELFQLKFGSNLYGTNTPASDLDIKAVYLPTAREIVLGTYKKTITTTRPKQTGERNTKDDIDVECFSLDQYLKLLCEGQTVALDILFAPFDMFLKIDYASYHIFREIIKNKDKLICKDITSFMGYAKQQANKYGLKGFRVAAFRDTFEFLKQFKDHQTLGQVENRVPLEHFVYRFSGHTKEQRNEYVRIVEKTNPKGTVEEFLEVAGKFYSLNCNIKMVRSQIEQKFQEYGKRALMAENNQGVDWKACSHAVRVNSQGTELLTTGKITFPRPDRELLTDIKTGKLQYKEVEEIILKGFEDLKCAEQLSTLRSKPDLEWCNDFLYDVYGRIVRNGK